MARPNGAVQIDFTVAAPGTVQPWTDAWQGGLYFDPMLSRVNADLGLRSVNDNDHTIGAGQGHCDASLALALAGTCRPVLTAACNQPNGPGLQQHQPG